MKYRVNWLTPILTAVVLFACSLPAMSGEGGLSADNVAKIRASFEMDRYNRAMYNAVTNNNLSKLALNRDILREHNEIYSHKIKTKGITNQKSSGRCWLFSSLNMFRPVVIDKYNLDNFEFSQNYLAFWDKMEKSNTFLEFVIEMRDRDTFDRELSEILRHPIGDGGYWSYTVELIKKYGAVPKEIMPETNSSGNTGEMNNILERKLRTGAAAIRKMHQAGRPVKELRAEKDKILADVYKILIVNLGEPPTEFVWRYEIRDTTKTDTDTTADSTANANIDNRLIVAGTYTPKKFFEEVVAVDLDQYVNIFDNPTREYNNHFVASMARNMYDGKDLEYVSVPVENLKAIAMKSILNDDPVLFACDVGKDQDREDGIMAMNIYDYGTVFNTDLSMSKADMCNYYESTSNHMMLMIGVDILNDKPVKWQVENSWGDKNGSSGYWAMYNDWFGAYVYSVIVKKEYVPEEILKLYDKKPIVLPVWDPNTLMIRN
ncbi:MAG: aminopeptidase [candidate division Zixibacteria bacterium HGW-Zixibacteria-1]|nr:MAG: aminopeptidase [candidate division Zixibacteria bacterium HGW-Zixibacteria-1]